MAIASFGGIEIPGINDFTEHRVDLSQNRRVAGGSERRDAVAVKRTWDVRVKYIDADTVETLEDYLDSIMWGYDDWWIDDFGSTSSTVVARIDAQSWTKARILGRSDLRSISFTVIER